MSAHSRTTPAAARAVLALALGLGVGAALFARTMAWAREAGYDDCMVHFLTASRAAPFWRGLGFQPVSEWMRRLVDERAIWAHG